MGCRQAERKFKEKTGLKNGARVRYIGVTDVQLQYWSSRYADPRDILDFNTNLSSINNY